MIKRILLALALTASLGGAVLACNTPASPSPTSGLPSAAPSLDGGAPSTEASPSGLESAAPSSS
jgi:hypothetical protein